jgi:hypothetical protein
LTYQLSIACHDLSFKCFFIFSGCFRKASFLCRSKTEIIQGNLILFTYSELEHATNKFSHSNLIGLGGSSYVYHGQLKDGRTVAVKRLKAQGGPDADFLFSTEVPPLLGTPFSLLSNTNFCI